MMAINPNPTEGIVSDADFPRPAFHFTPPSGWMNDPNGLVFYDGEYHLFYQHNPTSPDFGPMHWGHAVSTDLVHWRHLPIALEPDELGLIYSGCVVVDWDNTSGFGSVNTPPLVALFTYHHPEKESIGAGDHQYQAVAYSIDRGRSWVKYAENPVLPNYRCQADFRDPKVFWHDKTGRWVMVLAVRNHVELFASSDLKAWSYLSSFGENLGASGGIWECPDLFQLPVENSDQSKWVLIVSLNPGGPQGGSGTQYFIGDFDGESFSLDGDALSQSNLRGAKWLDWGGDNYAGVTWSDIPHTDGRRLFIGWMSNWLYAQNTSHDGWRGSMTAPRELRLKQERSRVLLASEPARELKAAMRLARRWDALDDSGADISRVTATPFRPGQVCISASLPSGADASSQVGVELRNQSGDGVRIGYRHDTRQFFVDANCAKAQQGSVSRPDSARFMPRGYASDLLELSILIDERSVEIFADGGVSVMTETVFPGARFAETSVFCEGEGASVRAAEISYLTRAKNR
jgi:fructan beta-fructosidase